MTTPSPMDPAPFAERAFTEGRCRRYLFDRTSWQDPRAPVGDAEASSRLPPDPPSMGWDDGLAERR